MATSKTEAAKMSTTPLGLTKSDHAKAAKSSKDQVPNLGGQDALMTLATLSASGLDSSTASSKKSQSSFYEEALLLDEDTPKELSKEESKTDSHSFELSTAEHAMMQKGDFKYEELKLLSSKKYQSVYLDDKDQFNPKGEKELLKLYKSGVDLTKASIKRMLELEYFAETLKQPQAMFDLASCYRFGYGGKELSTTSLKKSFELLEEASNLHLGISAWELGFYYTQPAMVAHLRKKVRGQMKPLDVSDRSELAIQHYKKGAELGFAKAQNFLGSIYDPQSNSKLAKYLPDDEQSVEVRSSLALKWYKSAADLGLYEAQTNTGICYELGIGVPNEEWADKDARAQRYFKLAEENEERVHLTEDTSTSFEISMVRTCRKGSKYSSSNSSSGSNSGKNSKLSDNNAVTMAAIAAVKAATDAAMSDSSSSSMSQTKTQEQELLQGQEEIQLQVQQQVQPQAMQVQTQAEKHAQSQAQMLEQSLAPLATVQAQAQQLQTQAKLQVPQQTLSQPAALDSHSAMEDDSRPTAEASPKHGQEKKEQSKQEKQVQGKQEQRKQNSGKEGQEKHTKQTRPEPAAQERLDDKAGKEKVEQKLAMELDLTSEFQRQWEKQFKQIVMLKRFISQQKNQLQHVQQSIRNAREKLHELESINAKKDNSMEDDLSMRDFLKSSIAKPKQNVQEIESRLLECSSLENNLQACLFSAQEVLKNAMQQCLEFQKASMRDLMKVRTSMDEMLSGQREEESNILSSISMEETMQTIQADFQKEYLPKYNPTTAHTAGALASVPAFAPAPSTSPALAQAITLVPPVLASVLGPDAVPALGSEAAQMLQTSPVSSNSLSRAQQQTQQIQLKLSAQQALTTPAAIASEQQSLLGASSAPLMLPPSARSTSETLPPNPQNYPLNSPQSKPGVPKVPGLLGLSSLPAAYGMPANGAASSHNGKASNMGTPVGLKPSTLPGGKSTSPSLLPLTFKPPVPTKPQPANPQHSQKPQTGLLGGMPANGAPKGATNGAALGATNGAARGISSSNSKNNGSGHSHSGSASLKRSAPPVDKTESTESAAKRQKI